MWLEYSFDPYVLTLTLILFSSRCSNAPLCGMCCSHYIEWAASPPFCFIIMQYVVCSCDLSFCRDIWWSWLSYTPSSLQWTAIAGDCLFDKWAGNAASIDQWAPRSWLGRVPPHSPSLYVVLQFIGLLASTQNQTRKHLASLKQWAKTHLCVITRCVSCCRGRCSYNVAILALGTQIFWWC